MLQSKWIESGWWAWSHGRRFLLEIPFAVLSASNADLAVLTESLVAWSTCQDIQYRLEGLDGRARTATALAVQRLVTCKAFPGSDKCFVVANTDSDMHAALQRLFFDGFEVAHPN